MGLQTHRTLRGHHHANLTPDGWKYGRQYAPGTPELAICAHPITHLSPHLLFTGKNENGISADFTHCHSLKKAEGVFAETVIFDRSGIESSEGLKATGHYAVRCMKIAASSSNAPN